MDGVSPGAVMPGAPEMLDYINSRGIRSGVISNIMFSGAALTRRINRLLPNNRFEFIIASSDYMFRKPSPMLFELALRKAGLGPDKVWFVGDNAKADIEGAQGVKIYHVWYTRETPEDVWTALDTKKPDVKHLRITEHRELIEALDKL